MRNGGVLWLQCFAGTDGSGCMQSPARCTNAEPLGFLLHYLHMMHRAVLIQPFQQPHIQINWRAWLHGDRVLSALLAVAGTRMIKGAVGEWVHPRSLSAVPACRSSASEILLLVSPPRRPVYCQEGLRAVVTPKSFHRSLWGCLFYSPVRAHEYQEYSSSIHPTVSLNFLQSLEGWVQNSLRVTGKLGKIRYSEI